MSYKKEPSTVQLIHKSEMKKHERAFFNTQD